MRKILILFAAIILSLFAFEMNADDVVKVKIPLQIDTGNQISRNLSVEQIESCYYGMLSVIYTSVVTNLGAINVKVINCSTGELWEDNFDSSSYVYHQLPISGEPGFYEITYIVEGGDIYTGTFIIW